MRTAVWIAQHNPSGALAKILSRGVLRVGTAGDYQPMSYLDPAKGCYIGFDAELAEEYIYRYTEPEELPNAA